MSPRFAKSLLAMISPCSLLVQMAVLIIRVNRTHSSRLGATSGLGGVKRRLSLNAMGLRAISRARVFAGWSRWVTDAWVVPPRQLLPRGDQQ